MSVRVGLLALLAEGPMHASQLRAEFEQRTGGTWPLNIGQVWTTLQRLVRDDLVTDAEAAADDGLERFQLTSAGRAEVSAWWASPVRRTTPARDELAIKLALAVTSPGVDVAAVVQTQRTETLRALQDYTRLKTDTPDGDLAWSLVLDSLVFAAEAEVRWLDHVEARVARAARTTTPREVPDATGSPHTPHASSTTTTATAATAATAAATTAAAGATTTEASR